MDAQGSFINGSNHFQWDKEDGEMITASDRRHNVSEKYSIMKLWRRQKKIESAMINQLFSILKAYVKRELCFIIMVPPFTSNEDGG